MLKSYNLPWVSGRTMVYSGTIDSRCIRDPRRRAAASNIWSQACKSERMMSYIFYSWSLSFCSNFILQSSGNSDPKNTKSYWFGNIVLVKSEVLHLRVPHSTHTAQFDRYNMSIPRFLLHDSKEDRNSYFCNKKKMLSKVLAKRNYTGFKVVVYVKKWKNFPCNWRNPNI